MSKINKITIKENQKPTVQQLKRLHASKAYPVTFDDESPEYSLTELKSMHEAAIKKRAEQKKEVVAIRISPSTLKKAKSLGKGYTSFLSRLLDNAINDKKLVSRSL